MKKKLTFMFVALITVAAFAIQSKRAAGDEVKYALSEGDTFTSGQTVEVKDGTDVVATITYGETGGNAFSAAVAAEGGSSLDGYTAYTAGNGTNGNKPGGTFYTIKPVYNGTINVAVILNAEKAFYIEENGTALTDYNGITKTEKYYGLFEFAVKAGKSYKVYCSGSKLAFYGFTYVYEEPSAVTYAVNVADGITNGTVKVDKATAAEGEEVTITATPADGYMLDAISVTCKTKDLAVEVKNGKFTMPADDVTVNATFKDAPVDVTVEASDITDGDITAAIAAKAAGKPIKNITINLAANGAYTISSSIEANQGVIINGNGAKIDASSLAAPFIKMNPTPIFDAVESGQFVIKDPIKIEGVTISGLDNSLISDGGAAYAFDNFTILDCVIELLQTRAFSFDFSKSMPINFNITNSTIYSKTATSSKNFMSISGKRPDQITGYTGGAFKFENNTFVNCGTTKQFINTNTIKGKGNVKYTWTKNIFVDCGNKQIWDKLDNGNAPKDCSMNTYWYNGANAGEKYDTNVLTTDPGITAENIAAGKFTIGAASLQALYKTGDPRWSVDFAASQNVTTAASGYTTLVSVYPLDFTTAAGLTAYVVAADEDIDITNSKVKLTQVTEAAANTPVILLGAKSTEYTITVKADAAAVTGNLLKGSATTVTTLTADEAYLLKDGKFGLCTAGDLPAGKAYLPVPAGSASNELIIVIDEDVTGIDKVVTRDALENAKIYNLQGQEVKKAGKGIYIINGKKVVMK